MGDLTYAIILFVLILLVLAAYGMLQSYGLRIRRLERAVFRQHGKAVTDFPETKPDPVPEWEE